MNFATIIQILITPKDKIFFNYNGVVYNYDFLESHLGEAPDLVELFSCSVKNVVFDLGKIYINLRGDI